MLLLLMSLSLLILLIRSILDCTLGRLGLPGWFRKVYFSFHSQVRLRFKLAAGLGEPWCRDGVDSSKLSSEHDLSLLLFMFPGAVIWIRCLMSNLNFMLIILSAVLRVRVLYSSVLSFTATVCPVGWSGCIAW